MKNEIWRISEGQGGDGKDIEDATGSKFVVEASGKR